MFRIVRIKNCFTIAEIVLAALMLSMLIFVWLMTYSYWTLHSAQPLENLKAEIVEPVKISEGIIKFKGTYNRPVTCDLVDFHFHLQNTSTGDIITMTPDHLLLGPPANATPGKNLPIQFALKLSKAAYPGYWKSKYEGHYICHFGIFTQQKVQKAYTPVIEITP